MRVEISVESVDGVRVAARAGAARVEVCADLSDGGLTPSAALSEAAAELAEVHVLVLQQLARNWDGSDIRLHHYCWTTRSPMPRPVSSLTRLALSRLNAIACTW
jgi:hypothetical protein